MTLDGAQPSAPGRHLELWARDAWDDIIRIDPLYDRAAGASRPGLMIRVAVPADDPCMIDDAGHLITSADAYPSTVNQGGVEQTPEQQAKQVRDRIAQLDSQPGGPLLAVVPWDATPAPIIAADATPATRKQACDAYRAASPVAYVPNPIQVTAPMHGLIYGVVSFVSLTPAASYAGIRLDTPVALADVREVFVTDAGDTVDPAHRGARYLVSEATTAGRETQSFLLHPPAGASGASGTLTILTGLDSDEVLF